MYVNILFNIILIFFTFYLCYNMFVFFTDIFYFCCMQAKKEKDLGNEEYKKKNFEAALAHYNKAIELEPTNITFYNNVAGMIV